MSRMWASRTIHPAQCPQKTPSSCTEQGPGQTVDTTFSPVLSFMASTASFADTGQDLSLTVCERMKCREVKERQLIGSCGFTHAVLSLHLFTLASHDLWEIVQLMMLFWDFNNLNLICLGCPMRICLKTKFTYFFFSFLRLQMIHTSCS